jgi:adenylate cyclase
MGDEILLTVKHGSGLTRAEAEVELARGQFEALWPTTEGRRVYKTRHLVPTDSVTIEIDVFEGALAGLVTAEVEFDSEAVSEGFDPPDWIREEVTGDDRYANENLAVASSPPS